VVETHIHPPTDSTLLVDGIRVITRLLQAGKALNPTPWYPFADHQRAAQKRGLQILNARKDQVKLKAYRELWSLAGKVQGYARQAIAELKGFVGADLRAPAPHGAPGARSAKDPLQRRDRPLQLVQDLMGGDGLFQVGLQEAAQLSGRHRGQYLPAETGLWFGALHLAGLAGL
jgi:hypothetical protein